MLKCHIVRQLIPNYFDGLLDEESQKDVAEHIATCVDCEAFVKSVQIEIIDSASAAASAVKEVKYLKKFKKRTVIIVLLAVAFMLALFGIILKLFFWGTPVKSTDMIVNEYTAIYNEDDSCPCRHGENGGSRMREMMGCKIHR